MEMNYVEVLERLKQGERIQGILESGHGEGVVWYSFGYLHWRRYGESAQRATARDLEWIMDMVFRDCKTWDFCKWSDDHINYIPVSPKYKGIDLRNKHPNTFGV